jgi:hypothetical protein
MVHVGVSASSTPQAHFGLLDQLQRCHPESLVYAQADETTSIGGKQQAETDHMLREICISQNTEKRDVQ